MMRTITAVMAILVLSLATAAGAQAQAPRVPAPAQPSSANAESFDRAVARLQPVRVADGRPAPAKTKDVKPKYPPGAQKAHVQGAVIVETLVDADGRVAAARVLRSIPMLDGPALDAARRWRFKPTEIEGRRVPVLTIHTVTFKLLGR